MMKEMPIGCGFPIKTSSTLTNRFSLCLWICNPIKCTQEFFRCVDDRQIKVRKLPFNSPSLSPLRSSPLSTNTQCNWSPYRLFVKWLLSQMSLHHHSDHRSHDQFPPSGEENLSVLKQNYPWSNFGGTTHR